MTAQRQRSEKGGVQGSLLRQDETQITYIERHGAGRSKPSGKLAHQDTSVCSEQDSYGAGR